MLGYEKKGRDVKTRQRGSKDWKNDNERFRRIKNEDEKERLRKENG